MPGSPLEMIKSQEMDAQRMALYQNLDYKQLYNALVQLMDVISLVHVGLQGLFLIRIYSRLPILSTDVYSKLGVARIFNILFVSRASLI